MKESPQQIPFWKEFLSVLWAIILVPSFLGPILSIFAVDSSASNLLFTAIVVACLWALPITLSLACMDAVRYSKKILTENERKLSAVSALLPLAIILLLSLLLIM